MSSLMHGMNCAAHSLIHGPKSASYSSSPQNPGDLAPDRGIRDDDQPLALAEPRRRCPLGETGDPFDHCVVDAAVLEAAYRTPLHDDIGELHHDPPWPHGFDGRALLL
jgi:hypothetical protein